jgi:hypothetical protein
LRRGGWRYTDICSRERTHLMFYYAIDNHVFRLE